MICESILCIHTRTYMHYRQADVHLAHIYTAHKAPNNSGNSQGDEIAFVCVWFREPWLSSNCCSVNRCLKTLPRPTVFLWDFFYKSQVLCVRTDLQEWSKTRCWRSEAEGIQCSNHLTEHVLCYSKLYMEWFRKSWVVIFLALTCVYMFIYCTFSRCLKQ